MAEDRRAGPPVFHELVEWVGYLRDIGVRELRAPGAVQAGSRRVAAEERPPKPRRVPSTADRSPVSRRRGAVSPTDSADVRRSSGAGSIGETRPAAPKTSTLFSLAQGPAGERSDPVKNLQAVRDDLGECTRCRLHEGRTNIVFGVGDPAADLMFVGEGPGADEDAQGEPFVGRAGQKLNEMIRAIGLEREQVYIANVVKCRPPQNRDPRPDEVATCSPFLFRQIEAIRPKVIVTLGSPATKLLLNTSAGISRLRGSWQDFRGIPVMPTFHPAYLLRAYTQENRRKVWEDLKAARARLDELRERR